jgi:16S rRNA processing protein RimM
LGTENQKTRFTLGLVGSSFGLKGFVKVKPLSGETAHFSRLKQVILRQNEKEETRDVAELVLQGETLIMRFAGVENPEAASLFLGAEIIAGREYAAPLKKGEFYVEDLKGLEVISREGEVLGLVSDLVEGGGGYLAEVKLPAGETRLVPFRNEFFGDVDLQAGRIVLLEPWILDY